MWRKYYAPIWSANAIRLSAWNEADKVNRSSKQPGVHHNKRDNKWVAQITIRSTEGRSKAIHLGVFDDEITAGQAVVRAKYDLKHNPNFFTDLQARKKQHTSKHRGVCWNKRKGKWVAQIMIKQVDGKSKQKQLGYFTTELAAVRAIAEALPCHEGGVV